MALMLSVFMSEDSSSEMTPGGLDTPDTPPPDDFYEIDAREDISDYEKMRLKNIREREQMFMGQKLSSGSKMVVRVKTGLAACMPW